MGLFSRGQSCQVPLNVYEREMGIGNVLQPGGEIRDRIYKREPKPNRPVQTVATKIPILIPILLLIITLMLIITIEG